jgi:transposase InsO family protein
VSTDTTKAILAATKYDFRKKQKQLTKKEVPVVCMQEVEPQENTDADIDAALPSMAVSDRSMTTVTCADEQKEIVRRWHQWGHYSAKGLARLIKEEGYTWPGLHKMCEDICKRCSECQKHNTGVTVYHSMVSPLATLPMDHIAIDMSGPHRTTDNEEHYLLVLVDVFSQFVLVAPLKDKSMLSVAQQLVKWFSNVGFPRVIQSDNGSEFVNSVISEMLSLLEVEHRLTTPYHPHANGVVERKIQDVIALTKKCIKAKEHEWSKYTDSIQSAMNLRITGLHGSTAFTVFFGRKRNLFKDFREQIQLTANEDEILRRVEQLQKFFYPATVKKVEAAQKRMHDKFALQHKVKTIPDGAMVMAVNEMCRDKMEPRYEGPYKVVCHNRGGAYILMDRDGQVLGRNFAPSQLKMVLSDAWNEDSFVIHKILDHRGDKGKEEYLVEWKEPKGSRSWEPYNNFDDQEVIRQYWRHLRSLSKTCTRKQKP